ncbi:hypothetical protein LCGC14_3010660 [marine sediment metagenome]|uniref:Phage virion morphogenesis protein n=1 Tax=marine sediment metagenome TaxID=412755 RepID=A0A0F8XL34_9ZZZZ
MARPRKGIRIKIHPLRLLRKSGDQLEKNMMVATIFVRDKVKKKLNRGQPTRTFQSGSIIGLDPSSPGEPPKKITAQLQNSIRTKVIRRPRAIIGLVGTNLKKGRWLEFGTSKMKPRPYLRPTLSENRRKIGRVVARGIRAL